MNKKFIFLFLFLLLFLSSSIFAQEQYTYEKAEELTPLIHWREYGAAPFQEAIDENKPIFLLLTAPSWCYWCQVYESEDYLFHPDMVKYVNEHTIPIYVDADKRQDLTRKYLEGGWPSTTILTPDRKRIFGYSGPRPVSFMIANLKEAEAVVARQGFTNRQMYTYKKKGFVMPTSSVLLNLIRGYTTYIPRIYDSTYGGFGTGQKFPQGRTLDFSLEVYDSTKDRVYLDLVKKTLEEQYTDIAELDFNYNLFDPIDGGFHRYGTKQDWTPPHYEKMLYDNARLLKAFGHLQAIIPNDEMVNEVIEKTLSFVQREWYDERKGGFYGNSDVHGENTT